jgi:hypothetical protein
MKDSLKLLLEELTVSLGDDPDLRRDVQDELASHFEEGIEEAMASGEAEEQAMASALENFGPIQSIADDIFAANLHRMRVRSLIKWVIRAITLPVTFILILFYGLAGALSTLVYQEAGAEVFYITLAILVFWMVWGVIAAITVCRKFRRDRRVFWQVSFLAILTAGLFYLVHDDPPCDDKYKWSTLPVPEKDAQQSFDVLMNFRKGGPVALRYNEPHIPDSMFSDHVLHYADVIEQGWKDAAPVRAVVEELDTFDQISDLLQHYDDPSISYMTLRSLAHMYRDYAYLKAAQGRPAEGLVPLATLHSVSRKALPCSRTLVRKMMLISVCNANMEVAWRISNSPNCTPEVLDLIRETFPPLSVEEVSPKIPIIAESIASLEATEDFRGGSGAWDVDILGLFRCGEVVSGGRSSKPKTKREAQVLPVVEQLCTVTGTESPSRPERSKVPANDKTINSYKQWLRRGIFVVSFRKNQTRNEQIRYLDLVLEDLSQQPPDITSSARYAENFSSQLHVRNIMGSALVIMSRPNLSRLVNVTSKAKVASDLLALEMSSLSGRTLSLPDFFTGDEYLRDPKTRGWRSAGPDRRHGTKDDITLDNAFDR